MRYDAANQRASTQSLLARDETAVRPHPSPMCPQHEADGRPRLPSAQFGSPGEDRRSSPHGLDWRRERGDRVD